MTFEIWLAADDGTAVLMHGIDARDRKALHDRGWQHVCSGQAGGYTEAQDRFVEWCRHRHPNVTEEVASRAEMLGVLRLAV